MDVWALCFRSSGLEFKAIGFRSWGGLGCLGFVLQVFGFGVQGLGFEVGFTVDSRGLEFRVYPNRKPYSPL